MAGEGEQEEIAHRTFTFLVPFPNLAHVTLLINKSATPPRVQTKEHSESVFQARWYLGR